MSGGIHLVEPEDDYLEQINDPDDFERYVVRDRILTPGEYELLWNAYQSLSNEDTSIYIQPKQL